MARGAAADVGAERWSANGYLYRKTPQGWMLVHRLIAADKLGRPLTENERVTFKDNDRTNLDPSNIVIIVKKIKSTQTQLAQLDAKIQELQAQRRALLSEQALDDFEF